MTHTHTTGPWTVIEQVSADGSCTILVKGGDHVVCKSSARPKYRQQQEVNAALIAAAPDLLAALIAVVAKAMPLTVEMGSDPYNPFPTKYEPHIEQVRAAIAKATGVSR